MSTLSALLVLSFLYVNVSAKNPVVERFPFLYNGVPTGQSAFFRSGKMSALTQQLPGVLQSRLSTMKLSNQGLYKEKLDSIVSVGDWKTEYAYDNNGNVIVETSYIWEAGSWGKYYKFDYEYNNNGKLISFINYSGETGEWIKIIKSDYTYNTSGKVSVLTFQMWENDQWVDIGKYEYTYDNDANLVVNDIYSWESGQWVNASKNQYEYRDSENKILVMGYRYNSGQWEDATKIEHTMNIEGKIVSSFGTVFDAGQWVNYEKAEYAYTGNGNISLFQYQVWEDSVWQNEYKYEFAYDSYGNMVTLIAYEREEETSYKTVVIYDLSVSLSDIAIIRRQEPPDLLAFILTIPWYSTRTGTNKADSTYEYTWDSVSRSWELGLYGKYYYSPFIVPIVNDRRATDSDTHTAFSIRSNHTGSVLYITNHTGRDIDLVMYATNGKTAKRFSVSGTGSAIDISSYAPGVYFIRQVDEKNAYKIAAPMK